MLLGGTEKVLANGSRIRGYASSWLIVYIEFFFFINCIRIFWLRVVWIDALGKFVNIKRCCVYSFKSNDIHSNQLVFFWLWICTLYLTFDEHQCACANIHVNASISLFQYIYNPVQIFSFPLQWHQCAPYWGPICCQVSDAALCSPHCTTSCSHYRAWIFRGGSDCRSYHRPGDW